MIITYLSLSESYTKLGIRAKEQNYVWIMSLVARYAEAEEIYEKVEKDWASLNDLTQSKILFVFSSPRVKKRASFFRIPGKPVYEGEMCPYIELINGKNVEDNTDPFEYMYPNYNKIDWKEKHSQSISQFAKDYNIKEEEIPCLFFWNLKNNNKKIVPISLDTDIYAVIKTIICEIDGYSIELNKINQYLEEYQMVDKYYQLHNEIEVRLATYDSVQQEVVRKILTDNNKYKEYSSLISNKSIKRDLKRIGQWKKQFMNEFWENKHKQEHYESLRNARDKLNKILENVLDEINIEKMCLKTEIKGERDEMKKVNIFLSYCWKDDEIADYIYEYYKNNLNVELHRDKIKIEAWKSIKEHMQSIPDMDYIILIITDSYLKSENCMYEVLEVMRDRRYGNKIFPVLIETDIYSPVERVKYIKYWKEKFEELHNALKGMEPHEMGKLGNNLKRIENIKNNIADFLDKISDMNNPNILDVNKQIEEKLKRDGVFIENTVIKDIGKQKSLEYSKKSTLELTRKLDKLKRYIYIDRSGLDSLLAQINSIVTQKDEVKILNVVEKLLNSDVDMSHIVEGFTTLNELSLQTYESKIKQIVKYIETNENLLKDRSEILKKYVEDSANFVHLSMCFDTDMDYNNWSNTVELAKKYGYIEFYKGGNDIDKFIDEYEYRDSYYKQMELNKTKVVMNMGINNMENFGGVTSHLGVMIRATKGHNICLGVFGSIRKLTNDFYQIKPYAVWLG